MALLKSGNRSRSPVKRKKREHSAVVTAMPFGDTAAASASANPFSQPAADGLLRIKKIRKQLAGSQELRSVLAPLAAAGAVASSGATDLLGPSTPHATQHEQLQQQQVHRQQKGQVKALEDLLLRGRLPVLRSCLLPSPSPSLRTLVLERLAVEAAAFPAAFSPFQLLSTSAALPPAGNEAESSSTAAEAEDNHEGKAVVAFLTLLKDAIQTAPAAAVSFDAEGRIHDRRTAVLLKRVVRPCAAAPHLSEFSSRSGDSSRRSGDSSRRSGDSSSRSGDSSSRSGDSSSKDVKGVRGSNVSRSSRKNKKGTVGDDEGNIVKVGDRRIGEEREGEDRSKGEHWTAFTFEAPVAVHVVGSFPLNLTSAFAKNVDVCVMMPAHMFGSRDHINYRYFNKRSVYIQLLYEHLRDVFIALFPSASAATAPACSSSSADPRREGFRVAARRPSGGDSLPTTACKPTSTTPATQASSAAIAAACAGCAASAAAFRSAAPQVLPRLFLQAWQGCVEKPVISVRFVAVQQRLEGEAGKHTSPAGRSDPRLSPLQQQEQRTLQQQQLLQQWNVRVLAVPSVEVAEPNSKQQHQRSKASESSSLTSNRKEASSRGERRKPFADHLLAVDRNCVRVPTTCCRSLSNLLTPVSATADVKEKAGVVQEQQQDAEDLPPTPYYNMLLLEDLRLRQHQRLLYRCCRLYGGGFREAVLLLKLWALRRGLLAADATCLSSHVATTASPPAPLKAGEIADVNVFWKETSDVSGFLLAMLCCHACLAAADSLATPLLAQQLLTLTLSFLAEANFLQFVYILGDPQPYRRQDDLKALRGVLGGGSSTLAEDTAAAAAVQRGRRTASSLVGETTGIQTTAERKEPAIADALAVGLIDEAYLFDSPSCCFNLLWRAQLHVAELQQEARSSLQALQRSADAFHFVFAPPPSASSARTSVNSNSSTEHAQLYGLLQGDVQLYIPEVPQQPHLYFPAAAYPLGNYLPFSVHQQRPRGDAAVATVAALNAAAAAAGGSSSDVAALDATPKWETPQPALLAASVLRLFVRGLGDRLRCYRVRLRRACCQSAAASDTGQGARLHAEADPEAYTATEGQPLAWTAESAEDFLRGGAAVTGLVISLELNAATAARLVERGPSAAVTASAAAAPPATAGITSPGATGAAAEAIESFKLFWGPTRVEVRRFHDAQTLYAVVWQRPSVEEEQLQALLCHRSPDLPAVTASVAASSAAVPSQPHHSAGGRVAAAAASSAAAAPQSREEQPLIHPPPHTQIIRHVLQRHLSHLLLLKQREDDLQQQQQQQRQQQSGVGTCPRGQMRHVGASRKKKNNEDRHAISDAPVLSTGVCYLESTPLGAVPSLSQRHKQLIQTFNELRNTVCALSSLPLAIKQIWHAGAALRFTDALPLPDSGGPSTAVAPDELECGLHRVVVEFEDSAAWPDDMAAVRHVKIAFLLAMRKELLSDHGIYGVVSPCGCLDVELGVFTFRIIIFHPAEAAGAAALYAEPRWEPLYSYLRERSRHSEVVATTHSSGSNTSSSSNSSNSLESGSQPRSVSRGSRRKKGFQQQQQQQEATGDEMAVAEAQQQVQQQLSSLFSSIDTEEEDAVLARPFANPLFARKYLDAAQQQEEERRLSCLRCMWWEPQVAAVLHACALRYPPFAGCVRLAKRWVAEMQLPACMHLLEHIIMSLFVETGKWGFPAPPQSVHVAFLRFLYVVSSFDWEDAPFIVCFDSDAPLGTQREQMMKHSFEKFRRYPSVQSLFDPHGFIIPLPDAITFTRLVRAARCSLASIVHIPLCPSSAPSIWKNVFSFDEWSSMDFILFLRKDFSVTETNRSRKRYANDFRPTSLPSCLASVSLGSGETAAVTQLLVRAAASSEQHVKGLGSSANQPGARILFSPPYVRRFLFLRFLRELLCSVWTANQGAFRASEPALLGIRSTVSLAYNPLKAALPGGGMPGVVGVKLNAARAGSGGLSLFLARSVQPSVTFPRCCFLIESTAGEHGARNADADGEGRKDAAVTDEQSGRMAGRTLEVDCLNPVLLMAGFVAAGGELVESIQIGGC